MSRLVTARRCTSDIEVMLDAPHGKLDPELVAPKPSGVRGEDPCSHVAHALLGRFVRLGLGGCVARSGLHVWIGRDRGAASGRRSGASRRGALALEVAKRSRLRSRPPEHREDRASCDLERDFSEALGRLAVPFAHDVSGQLTVETEKGREIIID
jgi:hypothetical protein